MYANYVILHIRKKVLGEKCEEFCTRHNGCNIEITKSSIGELKSDANKNRQKL